MLGGSAHYQLVVCREDHPFGPFKHVHTSSHTPPCTAGFPSGIVVPLIIRSHPAFEFASICKETLQGLWTPQCSFKFLGPLNGLLSPQKIAYLPYPAGFQCCKQIDPL